MMKLIPFLLLFSANAFAVNLDLGVRSTFNTENKKGIYQRNYLDAWEKISLPTFSNLEGNFDFRTFLDHNSSRKEADFRSLYVLYRFEKSELRVGQQIYNFSETFGQNIANIANPRDYTDAFLNDSSWSELSIPSINYTYVDDGLTLMPLWTLKARGNRLPVRGTEYDLTKATQVELIEPDEYQLVDDSEFGLRMGYLFSSGLDVKALLLNHYSRAPVIILNEELKLVPVSKRVTSTTLSSSYALDSIVFREDVVFTFKDLTAPYVLTQKERSHFQSILGSDYVYQDFNFGIQHHYDSTKGFQWLSILSSYNFFERKLKLELLAFVGINNSDSWIRPRATVSHQSFTAEIWVDALAGKEAEGGIGYYKNSDRFGVDVKADF